MKISVSKQALVILGLSITVFSCHKSDNSQPQPVAGKGGNATIAATPQHHGRNIDSCTIFIKYNTNDAPGDGRYDDSAVCKHVNGIPVATFTQLKEGKYYLYGHGWDTAIKEAVVGGIPYNIPDTTTTTYNVNVPVSED